MIVLMIIAIFIGAQEAETPNKLFAQANQLFESREFETAAEAYQQLIETGFNDPLVEYNLGNALYRTGDIGRARLHYERALRLHPGFEDARFNIGFIEERMLKASLRESNFTGIDQVFWNIIRLFPASISLPVAIICYILLNLLIAFRILRLHILPPAASWTLLIGSTLISALAFTAIVSGELLANSDQYGVIIAGDVDVASEPSSEAPSRFPAPVAMKVIINRIQGDWFEIVLPNGTKGWVTKETIGII